MSPTFQLEGRVKLWHLKIAWTKLSTKGWNMWRWEKLGGQIQLLSRPAFRLKKVHHQQCLDFHQQLLFSIEIYELSSTEIFILPPSEINILLPICLKENLFSDDVFHTECMCPKSVFLHNWAEPSKKIISYKITKKINLKSVRAGLDCFSVILCPRKSNLVSIWIQNHTTGTHFLNHTTSTDFSRTSFWHSELACYGKNR